MCKYSEHSLYDFPEEVAQPGDCEEGWDLDKYYPARIEYRECHDEEPADEWLCDACREAREERLEEEEAERQAEEEEEDDDDDDDDEEEEEEEEEDEEEEDCAEVEEERLADAQRWLGYKDAWLQQMHFTFGAQAPLPPVRMGE